MPDLPVKTDESKPAKKTDSSVSISRQQIGTRVRDAVTATGLNQKEVADRLNVSEATLLRYRKGKVAPDAEFIARLAALSGHSAGYLVTGEEGVNDEAGQYSIGGNSTDEAFVYVPRYDIGASAGGGAEVHSEQVVDYLAFRADWVRSQGLTPARLALVEAVGDSMADTIADRDLLLVNLEQQGPERPGVYVLRHDSTLLAKRLEVRWGSGGVIISSDNEAYDDQVLDAAEAEQLQILGKVVWLARRL